MSALGEAIGALRASYGMSVADLARLSGLPISTVTGVEAGTPPSSYELSRVAAGLGVDPAALYAGKLGDPKRSTARFRAPQGAEKLPAADARLLAVAAQLGRVGAALREWLVLPSPLNALRLVEGAKGGPTTWRRGYQLGRRARLALAPEPAALPSIQRLLESVGIHVAFVDFETPTIEAASIFEAGAMPIVLLDRQSERVRNPLTRRAILGHELCHLLHDGGERDLTIVTREGDESPAEQRANGFAPSFLAPKDWVEPTKDEPKALVVEVAHAWGLTFEGAVWHVKNLKFISEAQARELLSARRPTLRRGSFEPDLPRFVPADHGIEATPSPLVSGLLSDLVVRAFLDGHISTARAREILVTQ